jgi:subtilisin family serine protease
MKQNICNSKLKRSFLVCFATIAAILIILSPALASDTIDNLPINPNRVLTKFKPGISQEAVSNSLAGVGVEVYRQLRSSKVTILTVTNKQKPIKAILQELNESGLVVYAEPDFVVHANTIPNDSLFEDLWGLHNTGQDGGTPDADIDAAEAWEITTGSPNCVVAVIDTGVDYRHQDLAANMWTNPGEIPANNIDDDSNGYVDDVYGIDPCNGDTDPMDDQGHGTHCSGTIGGVGNNGIGVAGVNWHVGIMALKFLDSGGSGYTSDAITCIDYAVMMRTNHGINVRLSSNSWGGGGFSDALYDAIEASGDAGMLFVAAAGNDGCDNDNDPHYPSSYDLPNILAVAATDRNDQKPDFSNWGLESVDLGAPGAAILSTTPGNTYAVYSGTSMATPHVSGACALLWGLYPSASHLQVKEVLMAQVDPIPAMQGRVVAGGRLNVHNALTCDPNNPQVFISLADGFTVDQGIPKVLTARLSACFLLRGAIMSARFSNGDAQISLRDDGVDPDAFANDGVYTGRWVPGNFGPVTVDFEAVYEGETYTAAASGTVAEFSGYYFDDQWPFDWIDISGSGTPLGLGDDDHAYFTLPFSVQFFGETYDHIAVGSNGQVWFQDDYLGFVNCPIPSDTGYGVNQYAGLFWDDLNPGAAGEIYWQVLGSSPERKLVVQYQDVPHYSNTGAASFEIIFYEDSSDILMQYRDVDFGSSSYNYGALATVGLQRDAAFGQQYLYNQPVLENGMAIRWYQQQPEVLSIDIANNQDCFRIGDTLETTLSINNRTAAPVSGDIWVAIRLPNGRFLFFPGFSDVFHPAANCINIPVGPFVADYPIVTHQFPEGSEGAYQWYAVIVTCGADVTNPANWLAVDTEEFTVSTGGGFFEDFNDGTADNWVTDGTGAWSVGAGVYHAIPNTSLDRVYYSVYNQDFADFAYGVDVRRTSGDIYKSMGMIFRSDGTYNNGYVFHITASGAYLIYKIINGTYTWLIPSWTDSSAIHTGLGVWNRLSVCVEGSTLEFRINGTVVETLSDSSLAAGMACVKAYGNTGDSDQVDFDNAELTMADAIAGTPKSALSIPATLEACETNR